MADALSAADVERLRELEAAATPGPWIYSRNAATDETSIDALRANDLGELVQRFAWERNRADAALIIVMRNALPALLAAVKERDRLRERLQEYEQEMIERGAETAVNLISDLAKRDRILAEIEKIRADEDDCSDLWLAADQVMAEAERRAALADKEEG